MPWPNDDLDTSGTDQGTDTPPRVMFNTLITRVKELIAGRGTANGVASLDANTLVPEAQLPTADTTKKGISERATQAEVDAGADTARHVTPATLAGRCYDKGAVDLALSGKSDVHSHPYASDTHTHISSYIANIRLGTEVSSTMYYNTKNSGSAGYVLTGLKIAGSVDGDDIAYRKPIQKYISTTWYTITG